MQVEPPNESESGCAANCCPCTIVQVREAHKAGIEVILDVVFNHTAEGNEQGPSISFR